MKIGTSFERSVPSSKHTFGSMPTELPTWHIDHLIHPVRHGGPFDLNVPCLQIRSSSHTNTITIYIYIYDMYIILYNIYVRTVNVTINTTSFETSAPALIVFTNQHFNMFQQNHQHI